MPLRALVDGVEVIAPTLTDAEWDRLRDAAVSITLPCCGSEGYLRRSAMGTPHFAHKRGAHCDAPGETIYHLKAKAEIVLACQRAGYTALTEVAGADWRADVLAARGDVRIAFEVQWSFLLHEAAVFRQERYARDGVRGCWFFRNPPPSLLRGDDLKADRDLPLFHLLANADQSFSVALNRRLYSLSEVVEALLTGRIRFCETAAAQGAQTLEIVPFPVACARCGKPTHVYQVDASLVAQCGKPIRGQRLEFRRELLAAVRELAKQQPGLRLGKFQEVAGENGRKELRFGCAHCGAAVEQEQIDMALYGAPHLLHGERFPVAVALQRPITAHTPHWCFPEDGAFCCEK